MFPMQALLSHAELTKAKPTTETAEARRAPRRARCGNLTLFPCVVRAEPVFTTDVPAEVRVIASISNVSTTGVGLIAAELLPEGLEFDVHWDQCEPARALRFEVVHSRPAVAGMYRVGARLIAGELPDEPAITATVRDGFHADDDLTESPTEFADEPEYDLEDENPVRRAGGIMKFAPDLPDPRERSARDREPAPPGTFKASAAFGFDKIEKLDGQTTCGWDRSIELRRDGDRLWLYIHSPGKKNGWGLYVDADRFEAALDRIQSAARSPFITSMAA
jgi:hypothetical protein